MASAMFADVEGVPRQTDEVFIFTQGDLTVRLGISDDNHEWHLILESGENVITVNELTRQDVVNLVSSVQRGLDNTA